MLKLEPSEERVMVALPYPKDAFGLVRELDRLLREKNSPQLWMSQIIACYVGGLASVGQNV